MAAKEGDIVRVVCTGKLDDGRIFYRNSRERPLEFRVGSHSVLPGLEEGIPGMEESETRELTLPPEKGFGEPRPELVRSFQKSIFPEKAIQKGEAYEVRNPKVGQSATGYVREVGRDTVTLDFNNPLCGKTVSFEVELVEIR
jgi:FKBP-type peptidyl-prolyl cis-trans isomerase 2